jgi:hypothetical protein
MKASIRLLILFTAAGFILASCEGPMGPKGDNGLDGADANANCTQCHNNDAVIATKAAQWSESTHATGGNAAYANRTGCVQCHTSQGFLEYVAEGSTASLTVPVEPMQINCYTCHKIHTTFTESDWALTKPGAQILNVQYAGAGVTWDKGNSNQCVACHQAFPVTPAPVANGADFQITNTRMGVHHGPNANLILGKTAFELAGTTYPTTNTHSTSDGCITCHMSTPYGYQAGGHNMSMKYDSHGTETRLLTGCTPCHDISSTALLSAFNTKISNFQTSIQTKLTTLENKLVTAGVYNTSTGLANAGTFKANAVMAYLNYSTIKEDRSMGIHNPGYVETLLDNSITAMTALGY